jgi:regulator of cell morphogenesis and NO signaling
MTAMTETVGQMVAERPARARVFDEAGIDYGHGEQTLAEACRRRGIDPDSIIDRLMALDRNGDSAVRNWSEISLADLCDTIVTSFHEPLKNELLRIGTLLFRVAEGDGERYPELNRILQLFSLFSGDLKMHMTKEEAVLFPLIKELETDGDAAAADLSAAIEQLEVEHQTAVRALAEMRELTCDFCPPGGACDAHRAVLDALQGLEHNLHEHFGIENNILFPRVFQMQFAGAR